jgi:cellulose biosynthesis protein BcsQ
MKYAWRSKLKKNIEDRYIQRPEEWYGLEFSTNGLVDVTIVSGHFADIPYQQRYEQIVALLRESDAPVRVGLRTLCTLSEADTSRLSRWIRPVSRADNWLDLTDQAINVTEYPKVPQREPRIPHTVTFYSFKGGIGRTTALIHVAWLLALRGHKVVAVDLDANAAGLGSLLHLTAVPEGDILDYFCERPKIPEDIEPTFPITKIFGEVRVPNASGRLFVVPINPNSLNYVTKLEVLGTPAIHAWRSKKLWSFFFQEITELLQPDIILIDSSAGFDEWAAFSLLRAADQAIMFLYPDEQNKRGIELLLEALGDTLPLQLVFSPVPLGDAGRERVREYWRALRSDLQEVETQLDMAEPITVPYLAELALAQSYPVLPLLSNYVDIANVIDEGTAAVRLKMLQTTAKPPRENRKEEK